MRAAGVEVGRDVGQVDVKQTEGLGAVHQRQNAALAGQGAQLLGGKQVADRARQVRKGQHLGSRGDRLGVGGDVVLHTRMRVYLRDGDDREAEALGLLSPRHQVAGMVVGKDDHLVAGLEIEATRDHVVGFAGVARDDDLFRRDPQEGGERLAGVLLLA